MAREQGLTMLRQLQPTDWPKQVRLSEVLCFTPPKRARM